MRVLVFVGLLCAVQVESQSNFWDYSQNFLTKLLRQGKNSVERIVTSTPVPITSVVRNTSSPTKVTTPYTTIFFTNKTQPSSPATPSTTTTFTSTQTESSIITKTYTSTATSTTPFTSTLSDFSTASTIFDTTTPDFVATTGEPRENPNSHDFYLPHIKREKPHIKMSSNISQKWTLDDWKRVLFSYETMEVSEPGEDKKGAACNISPRIPFFGGSEEIHEFTTFYLENILEEDVTPFAPFIGNNFLFMQDNARPHVREYSNDGLATKKPRYESYRASMGCT
ncbi:hypothetical protein YQE_05981, partial [Dendroctonus ponderosae]